MFIEITDTSIRYVKDLSHDEIDQLDDDIKSNGWRAQPIVEIENSIELLRIFQMFCYFNRRLPLNNGLLPVPDDETPERSEKMSMKTLYELFKDTKSLRLVSLQFLLALNLFYGGDIQTSKETSNILSRLNLKKYQISLHILTLR